MLLLLIFLCTASYVCPACLQCTPQEVHNIIGVFCQPHIFLWFFFSDVCFIPLLKQNYVLVNSCLDSKLFFWYQLAPLIFFWWHIKPFPPRNFKIAKPDQLYEHFLYSQHKGLSGWKRFAQGTSKLLSCMYGTCI